MDEGDVRAKIYKINHFSCAKCSMMKQCTFSIYNVYIGQELMVVALPGDEDVMHGAAVEVHAWLQCSIGGGGGDGEGWLK